MTEIYDDYDDYDDQFLTCPRCLGDGYLICSCGGDCCVCDNYGEAPCPLCYAEGVVSEEVAKKIEAARRRACELFNKAASESEPARVHQEGTEIKP